MKKDSLKKILPFLIIAIIAATIIFLPGGVRTFIDNFLFGISNFLNLGIFTNETSQIILVRGLLLIVTYFAFKGILKKIGHFKEEKKLTIGASLIIAIITSLALPKSIISSLATTASTFILMILVIASAVWAARQSFKTLKGPLWKELLGLILLIITTIILNAIYTTMIATI